MSYQQNEQGYPFCVTDMPPVRAQVSGSEVTNLVPVLMGLNFSTNGTQLFVLWLKRGGIVSVSSLGFLLLRNWLEDCCHWKPPFLLDPPVSLNGKCIPLCVTFEKLRSFRCDKKEWTFAVLILYVF